MQKYIQFKRKIQKYLIKSDDLFSKDLPSEALRVLLGSLESGSLGVPVIGWDILLLLGLVLEDVVTAGTIANSVGSKPPVESSVESGSGVTAEEKISKVF